jgi:hypothetical protein
MMQCAYRRVPAATLKQGAARAPARHLIARAATGAGGGEVQAAKRTVLRLIATTDRGKTATAEQVKPPLRNNHCVKLRSG